MPWPTCSSGDFLKKSPPSTLRQGLRLNEKCLRTVRPVRRAALETREGSLCGVFGYEGGEVWSPETQAILRQDGLAGLVANTPIGLATFGIW